MQQSVSQVRIVASRCCSSNHREIRLNIEPRERIKFSFCSTFFTLKESSKKGQSLEIFMFQPLHFSTPRHVVTSSNFCPRIMYLCRGVIRWTFRQHGRNARPLGRCNLSRWKSSGGRCHAFGRPRKRPNAQTPRHWWHHQKESRGLPTPVLNMFYIG